MSDPPKINIMISSQCKYPIKFEKKKQTLTSIRERLKEELEEVKLFTNPLFEVWINEGAPPASGHKDWWQHCLDKVRDADVVLVIYNGSCGWGDETGGIGICHAELQEAIDTTPAKVRLIELDAKAIPQNDFQRKQNKRFEKYIKNQGLFRGDLATNGEEVIARCKEALLDVIPKLVQSGSRSIGNIKPVTGGALKWSRKNYKLRQEAMVWVLRDLLAFREESQVHESNIFVRIGGRMVLVVCHGIPAAMSISAAREMVGQPFLKDHKYASLLKGRCVGPVHFIACHRNVTESQAMKMLGFPDAEIVSESFGVYVADDIQKIQLVFIANCRDDTSTRHGTQRVLKWLKQTGEATLLGKRAESRKKIVQTIAAELK